MAAEPRFSHKTHLSEKVRLTCITCHVTANRSVKAEDSLLPSPAICKGCHADDRSGLIRSKLSPRAVAKFNHSLHAKLGPAVAAAIAKAIDSKEYLGTPGEIRKHLDNKNVCSACHRGVEQADVLTAAHFPQMADCLTCHNRIEPPYSCEKCHVDVKALTPATHDQRWVDTHTDEKISKSSCAGCHGRRFTCQGCH